MANVTDEALPSPGASITHCLHRVHGRFTKVAVCGHNVVHVELLETGARVETSTEPARGRSKDPLSGRLGISVPYEWWASAALLKSYEAAGFDWIQLHSPPASVLSDPRQAHRHAAGVDDALRNTNLRAVIHAPGSLRLGTIATDRAMEGLLSYAYEIGAEQIVYHAMALPQSLKNQRAGESEAYALARIAPVAERLGVTIAIENLAPLYPGAEPASASPMALRCIVQRLDSPRIALCLDVGHAHVIADSRHTTVELLCEPVLDAVSVIHVHDNFGARRSPHGAELGVDPLRLDLHLPPGRGTLPWHLIGPMLRRHRAPLLLEVHLPYRPRAAELASSTTALLRGRPPRS